MSPLVSSRNGLADVLRGLSSHVVAAAHLAEVMVFPLVGRSHWLFLMCAALAHWSVIVFFALSGFVISSSLQAHIEKRGARFWVDFAKARIARIYPPLIAALLLTLAVIFICQLFGVSNLSQGGFVYLPREKIELKLVDFLGVVFHLQAFDPSLVPRTDSPLWSLGYEWWYYFIGALIFAFFFHNNRIMTLAILIVLFSVVYFSGNLENFIYFLGLWLVGFAAHQCFYRLGAQRTQLSATILSLSGIFLLMVVFLLIAFLKWWPAGAVRVLVEYGVAITTASSLLAFSRYKMPADLVSLGSYSYTLYLVHFPVFILVFALAHVKLFIYGPCAWVGISLTAYLGALLLSIYGAKFLEDVSRFRSLLSGK